jgi:hypothetical protein
MNSGYFQIFELSVISDYLSILLPSSPWIIKSSLYHQKVVPLFFAAVLHTSHVCGTAVHNK